MIRLNSAFLDFQMIFAVFAILPSVLSALECYECTSGIGLADSSSNTCDRLAQLESEDPSSSSKAVQDFLVDCGDEAKSCVSAFGKYDDTTVMTRECGRHPATNSCSSMELGSATATVCSCDQDGCNSGAEDIGDGGKYIISLLAVAAVVINGFS